MTRSNITDIFKLKIFPMRDEAVKFLGSKEATEPCYRVILVLESPHKDEYHPSRWNISYRD